MRALDALAVLDDAGLTNPRAFELVRLADGGRAVQAPDRLDDRGVNQMAKATQFCVALLNKPGTLARLCRTLARAGVNIGAITVSDNNECSWVRLVASPAATARAALSKGGYTYTTLPVLRLGLRSRAGELARVAGRLAKAGININYVYGSSGEAERSTLVLCTDDIAAASKALGR
jgi:hypothetical protein